MKTIGTETPELLTFGRTEPIRRGAATRTPIRWLGQEVGQIIVNRIQQMTEVRWNRGYGRHRMTVPGTALNAVKQGLRSGRL